VHHVYSIPNWTVQNKNGRRLDPKPRKEYVIGRGEECNVKFTPSQITEADLEIISRTHCKISKTATEVYLQDLSRNGTYVNSKKVRRHKRIISFPFSVLCKQRGQQITDIF